MTIDLELPEVKAAVEAKAKELADAEAGGLKKKTNELLDELKGLKAKYDGIDPDEFKALKEKSRKAGDEKSTPEELRAKIEGEYTPKLTAAEKRAEEAEAKLNAHVIESALTEGLIAANVAKDFLPAAKALLKAEQKIEVTESGATVAGKSLGEFIKGWAAEGGKPYVAADVNSGGGASHGKNGSGASGNKKRSEMSATEKSAFVSKHGKDAFLALPA